MEAGFGAILFDPEDGFCEYFGDKVNPALVGLLTHGGEKQQIVGQAELLLCLAARAVWAERMTERAVVSYVDNDVAGFAIIKGSSPTLDSAWLVGAYWEQDASLQNHI